MAEPRYIAFEDFTGGLNLGEPTIRLKANETDDQLNTIIFNGALIKRPGLAKHTVTAFGGPVYDMVPFGWQIGGYTYSWMLALVEKTADTGHAWVCYKPTYAYGGEADLYDSAAADTNLIAQLLAIGSTSGDVVLVTKMKRAIYQTGATPVTRAWTTAAAPGTMVTGCWHRSHLFYGMPDGGGVYRHYVYRSAYGTPESFDSDGSGTIILHQTGTQGGVMGLVSAGDTAYFMKANSIQWVTGYDKTTFRFDSLPTHYAGGYTRGFAVAGAGVYGFAVTEDGPPDGVYSWPRVHLHTIIGIKGQTVEDIGQRVRPLVAPIAYRTLEQEGCRAIFWPQRKWIIFIPTIGKRTAVATTAIVLDLVTNSFWKWEFGSANTPCSLAICDSNLWIGCVDGHIRFMPNADTYANDDGVDFISYWASSWMEDPNGVVINSDEIEVVGKQTSGGDSIISIATDGGDFREVGRVCLRQGNEDYAVRKISTVGLVSGAKRIRVKIQFPADGIGCEVHRITLAIKPQGRPNG